MSDEDREPLHTLGKLYFPNLEGIIDTIIVQTSSERACEFLYVVFKSFYMSNHYTLCKHFIEGNAIEKWISYFKYVLDMEVGEEIQVFTDET